jgi:hypothetical protein
MKTNRRQFFKKLGIAIAAFATGFVAAKAVTKEHKVQYCRSKTIKAISDCCRRELPGGYEAKILCADTGKDGMIFQELSGDYKNLGFIASLPSPNNAAWKFKGIQYDL